MTDAAVLTDRFDRALLYATHVHGGQVRKATFVPYIAHLLAVAATVLEYNGSEDMAIAALLHDAVEDQGGEPRLSDIRNRFGDRVADIVRCCSDTAAAQDRAFAWRQPGNRVAAKHVTLRQYGMVSIYIAKASAGVQARRPSPRRFKIAGRRFAGYSGRVRPGSA
jgi:(p)ppGpp synthase/HD superfamily hydrolase